MIIPGYISANQHGRGLAFCRAYKDYGKPYTEPLPGYLGELAEEIAPLSEHPLGKATIYKAARESVNHTIKGARVVYILGFGSPVSIKAGLRRYTIDPRGLLILELGKSSVKYSILPTEKEGYYIVFR